MVRLTDTGESAILRDAAEHLRDIRDRLGYAAHQVRRVERVILAFVAFSGAATVEDLRPLQVMRWLHSRTSAGVGRKTQLNDVGALRCFGVWLVSMERLAMNPLRGLKLPRVPRTRGCRPFTLEETRTLISVASRAETVDDRAAKFGPLRSTFYAFLARTGLRYAEAKVQRWCDIDLGAAVMVVTQAKGGQLHVVPLDDETVALLRRWRRHSDGDAVFPSVPSHHTLVRDCDRAGIRQEPGEWHRFRKMSITERAKRGATVRAMQRFARHADVKTTQAHYDFVEIEEMRTVADMLPTVFHNRTRLGKSPLTEVSRSPIRRVPTDRET